MELEKQTVKFTSDKKELSGYLVKPAAAKQHLLPVIIVIQEIWGVDYHIKDITERFSSCGYIGFAPDLYSENGTRKPELSEDKVEQVKAFLSTLPPQAWANPKAIDEAVDKQPQSQRLELRQSLDVLFNKRDMETFLKDLVASVEFVKSSSFGNRSKIGSVGFCMGGALSALLATKTSLDAAAIFYGSSPKASDLENLSCPLIGFYGGQDHGITDTVAQLESEAKKLGKDFTSYIYPDAPHAFFNDTRPSYRIDDARDAWAKVIGFFAEKLSNS